MSAASERFEESGLERSGDLGAVDGMRSLSVMVEGEEMTVAIDDSCVEVLDLLCENELVRLSSPQGTPIGLRIDYVGGQVNAAVSGTSSCGSAHYRAGTTGQPRGPCTI